jgi:hypothetical protein
MSFPIFVSFRHISRSRGIEESVRENAAALARHCHRIQRCRVVIDVPHHRHRKGNHYVVKVAVFLRHRRVVVGQDSSRSELHEDPHAAVHAAFEAAKVRVDSVLGKRHARHSTRGGNPVTPVPAVSQAATMKGVTK